MASYKLHLEDYQQFIPDFESFLKAQATAPTSRARRNGLRMTPEQFQKMFEGQLKIDEKYQDWLEVYLPQGDIPVGKRRAHKLGQYYVQGMSSQLPVLALDPKPGQRALDLCASPGGKTVHMAELMQNTGVIVANEPGFERCRVLRSTLDRMGVINTLVTKELGQKFSAKVKFDRILADVPCSAEGSSRGDTAEATFETKEGFRVTLHGIQRKILLNGFDLLEDNGTIVYSTCTYDPRENEMALQHLLDKRENAKIVPTSFAEHFEPALEGWKDKEFDPSIKNAIRVYPHKFDSWGFFCAKIVKQ